MSLIKVVSFDLDDQIRQDNTHGEGRISRDQPRSCRKGAVPQRSPILGVPFYLCIHPLTQNYQIWRGNTYGEEVCFQWVIRPTPRGRGPIAPQFWRFCSIYAYTLCRRTTKFDVITRREEACRLGSARPPITRQQISSGPQFGGSSVFMPTSINAERPIRHGNI